MNDPEIMQMFAGVGAIVRDSHFVYSSGRHSSVYINKDALYLHTKLISTLCQLMAQPYNADEVDVKAGPVLGGIVVSQWVAYYINSSLTSVETLDLYVDKQRQTPVKLYVFRRCYEEY